VSGTFCRNGPKGASPKRFLTPFSPFLFRPFSRLIVVGAAIYGIAALAIGENEHIQHVGDAFALVIRCVLFWLLLLLKAAFAPIVATAIVVATIYYLFEFHEFRLIPLLRSTIDWVFGSRSNIFHALYLITSFTVFLGSSVFDTRSDALRMLESTLHRVLGDGTE